MLVVVPCLYMALEDVRGLLSSGQVRTA